MSSEGWSEAQAQTLWTALQRCVRRTSDAGVPPVTLRGQLLPSRNGRSLPLSQDGSSMPVAFPTGTELPGKPKEHVRRVELDQRDIANDVLTAILILA